MTRNEHNVANDSIGWHRLVAPRSECHCSRKLERLLEHWFAYMVSIRPFFRFHSGSNSEGCHFHLNRQENVSQINDSNRTQYSKWELEWWLWFCVAPLRMTLTDRAPQRSRYCWNFELLTWFHFGHHRNITSVKFEEISFRMKFGKTICRESMIRKENNIPNGSSISKHGFASPGSERH